jgi:hypothetical protein
MKASVSLVLFNYTTYIFAVNSLPYRRLVLRNFSVSQGNEGKAEELKAVHFKKGFRNQTRIYFTFFLSVEFGCLDCIHSLFVTWL